MDIKTSPARYAKEICNPSSPFYEKSKYWEKKIKRCVDLAAAFPPEAREYRTVLVPPLVQKEDIKNMAEILPKDTSWQFAQFRNENCLNPDYNDILPYSDTEIEDLINYAKSFIKGATLR